MLGSGHMGRIEYQPLFDKMVEILDPRHFYAAYVFDKADTRQHDIQILIE